MIDYRINTFITLCELKSYTQTAKALCMTQPGVSQHIKYLEKQYGVKLIDSTTNAFTLTYAGEIFLQYCLQIKSQAVQMERTLSQLGTGIKKVNFGATLTIGEFVLPPVIKQYIKDYPDIHLSMIVDNTQNLLKKVKEGTLDYAFIEGYFNQDDFKTHLLKRENFIMVASPKHCLAKRERVILEDIKEQTLVIREKGSGTREVLENALVENNYPISNFKKVIEVGNLGGIKQLVRADVGITMIYEAAVREEIKKGLLIPIQLQDIVLKKDFQFIYMKGSLREQEYLEFLNYTRKHILRESTYTGNSL